MKIYLLVLSVFICFQFSIAQECNITLEGRIIDSNSEEALEYGNVYVEETASGTISDSTGYFKISNLCSGDYHLTISHVGCENKHIYISVFADTFLEIQLHHHSELLNELTVHGNKSDYSIQTSNTISNEVILSESHKNLGDILATIQGVSTLKTGGNVSKPVVHGLYGNRISISNNGVIQSGQQWGNDHAPEIDAFNADHISVIKGTSALAYGGNSLGSVILIESKSITEDPHLHGLVNYRIQSNGVGHTLNSKIEKHSKWAAWRLGGTLKFSGDQRSSKYYLTNTGKREYNILAQAEKKFNKKWKLNTHYSLFSTEIGILRGLHIGNVTDLEKALTREEPFYTKDNFSYKIEAPRQKVSHHLIKLESLFQVNEHHSIELKYGGQLNQRKEFDIRRLDRSAVPSLSLFQNSQSLSTSYNGSLDNKVQLKSGLQFNFTDNTNSPETGVLPLIPDYRSLSAASYFIFKKHFTNVSFEWGGRYNLKSLEAITIVNSNSSPTIERYNHLFHNYSLSSGIIAKLSPNYKFNFEMGYALRSPEVNELYSFGLHQGVSGIEEGSRFLNPEKSLKLVFSNDFDIKDKVFIQALGYYQNIQNYIYLQLQDELRLTIQGAFPVFNYTQTTANLFGADLISSIAVLDNFKVILKYAMIRGNDVVNNTGIINLPSDNFETSLNYSIKKGKKLRNSSFSLVGNYNFKQNKVGDEIITDNTDEIIIEVPSGYFLLNFKASTELPLKKSSLKFSLQAENILNKQYRNYLNRQRYFADDTGVDVSFSVLYEF